MSNYFNMSNVSNHYTLADDRSEILTWLSPLEPRTRHQDVLTRRVGRVGERLLQTGEFQRWCNGAQDQRSDQPVLFCCGDPAVGKTYFSSLVIDRLCDKEKGQGVAVACFYVDFAAREEQSPTNILGSLLKQIVGGMERIPDEISRTSQDHKKVTDGRGLRVAEIVKMLQTVTSSRPTFICVDALDECVEGNRPEVLDSLRQILEKSPNTRIFLTGRRHIRSEIEKHLSGRAAFLSITLNSDDIVGYIRMRLSKGASLDAVDSGLEAEIIRSISENIPETFLQISLTMDAILEETTSYGRSEKLRKMTQGLDLKGVYGATLERIKEQGGEKARLGMAALMWVSHSERLLQLDELSDALGVEIGSTDLNAERIPSVETLLSSCLGFVVVDKEALAVRLVHFTLQEHLDTSPTLFGATHSIMAETCLTYLSFQTIIEISPTPLALTRSTPFLKYSSLYWGIHARKEASRNVVSLALKLFGRIESHISTKLLLLNLISMTGRYIRDIPVDGPLIGFTGLHCASVFGIVEAIAALLDQPNSDVNGRDFLGITPLIWAAICGHEGVAKLLLEQRNLNPDKPDKYFRRTALTWAAAKGHEGIVRILLRRVSAKPDGRDGWWGKTPRVVNMVRGKRYVNPNSPDKCGQTPILLAAEEGHEEVMNLLLGRKDVNPGTADGHGRTPLFCASSKGREGVAKLLVEREGASIDRPEKNGQTPLLWAPECGYRGAVGLLLGRKGINPNMCDNVGRAPLSLDSEKGREGVVRLLLGNEDAHPNTPDNDSNTSLFRAAMNEHDEEVQPLLEQEDVNIDKPDKIWQKPLLLAAENGYERAVGLLLRRKGINPNMRNKVGRTPLSLASRKGHERVVKLLLAHEDVNPNMPDNDSNTPLLLAAMNGREGVVRLLLEREDVNPNMSNKHGQTSLSWAAMNGDDRVVKLLLGRANVSPDMPDNERNTPLLWAVRRGCDGVVRLLLEREDVNPNMSNSHGRTPLSWAAMNGDDGVVKLLLGREDINPDMPGRYGRTPLSRAAMYGRDSVVELLLGREDVNPGMPDHDGRTPLSWAAMYGRDGVVKLLLRREDVNPNIPDDRGRTPLSLASETGYEGVVKLLLEREDVNSNIPNKDGLTPRSLAFIKRHKGVVKLLQARKSLTPI